MSNFDVQDEIYHNLDWVEPTTGVTVLASAFLPVARDGKPLPRPHIYETAPQVWTYEPGPYRAFVSLLGHNWATFERPNVRAMLMRAIAWAGKRPNVDELVSAEEMESLRYPEGGPSIPAKSLEKMEVHPEFTMKLAATEPLMNKAINLDWDPQGRMWVAESPEYPNGKRGLREDFKGKEWKDQGGPVDQAGLQTRKGLDRISILTDTDGDGVADKKQVFADDLELATGFVFYKDGVIVTQPPQVLFLRDTNGDGVADKREVLYDNLGTRDTHAVLNNPRWGNDGWIYATHGYSGSQNVKNADGTKSFGTIGSGLVRFRPDGSAMEQVSSKGGNTWGLTVTSDGELFYTQPTSGQLLMHVPMSESVLLRGKEGKTASYQVVIPSPKSYPAMKWENLAYVQIDWVGSFTAAAGTVIYEGGAWPERWNGSYFTTEPTINLVHHEFTKVAGASYTAAKEAGREEKEFIASKDLWFRPIEVRVGPDGALYVVDFYNQAAIHNDTRGPVHNATNAAVRPDRDHYFGRIWRVQHREARALPSADLSKGGVAGLIQGLSHPNGPVRQQALRLLSEQKGGADELSALVKNGKALPNARSLALWALFRQGQLPMPVLQGALVDSDAGLVKTALRIIAEGGGRLAGAGTTTVLEPAVESALVKALRHPDASVRLAALIAAGSGTPGDATLAAVMEIVPTLEDAHSRSAAIGVANAAPAQFLALAARTPNPNAALQPILIEVARTLARNPEAVAAYLVRLSEEKAPDWNQVRTGVIEPLAVAAAGAPAPTWDAKLEVALRQLLASPAADALSPLVSAWDRTGALKAEVAKVVESQLARVQSTTEPLASRLGALKALAATSGSAEGRVIEVAAALLRGEGSAELKSGAVAAIGSSAGDAGGRVLAGVLPSLSPELRAAAIAEILKRKSWTLELIKQVEAGAVKPGGYSRRGGIKK
jgi:putative membrane-bound dehydrogenase-like protein